MIKFFTSKRFEEFKKQKIEEAKIEEWYFTLINMQVENNNNNKVNTWEIINKAQ